MTTTTFCYLVDDETVINCDYSHRVIVYITLDKSKALEFVKRQGFSDLAIREVPLDSECYFANDYGVLRTSGDKGKRTE